MSGMTEEELELRLEYHLLLAERESLRQERSTAASLTARATTARNNATLTDRSILRAYLSAVRRGDEDACAAAESGMRERVKVARERTAELREILAALRLEAIDVRQRCCLFTPRSER